MNPLDATGLVLDVAGVVLLAWGVAFESAKRYTSTAGTWYSPAIDLARAEENSRAIVGVGLLATGFSFQALGALGVDGSSGWWYVALVLAHRLAHRPILISSRTLVFRENGLFMQSKDAPRGTGRLLGYREEICMSLTGASPR